MELKVLKTYTYTHTRYCTQCCQSQPYDPSAKKQSKAAGFQGDRCWACHTEIARLKMQARTKQVQAPVTYGEQIIELQAKLGALLPEDPQRKDLEYALDIRKAKAARFGPNAWDFTPAEVAAAKRREKEYK